jgi:leucyl-tRNA synthetase
MSRYEPASIEAKWQRRWEHDRTFATPRMPEAGKGKLYVLDMFPYPSGDGLHVGHPEGYTATDIVCRAARMQGKSVMHPMGFDAFGLPAEEHAIKTGMHPRLQTESNIATFRRQLRMLGFSYDWGRELATTDTDYFRWTQWIFLQIYDTWFDEEQQRGRPIAELPIPEGIRAEGEASVRRYQDEQRLARQAEAPVNWCPALGTVLANEEVTGGVSERGGHPVVRLPLRQWVLRITAYAERLADDLDGLDWPEGVKALQRNWIGRSAGVEVDFFIGSEGDRRDGVVSSSSCERWQQLRRDRGFPQRCGDQVLRVFTTRPDTLFGATYMVLAPEHAAVSRLTTPDRREAVEAYCRQAAGKSDLDRTDLAKEKTGEFTGAYAVNPVNAQPIPVWVADYVLISYGTGAIMAVPAHDERDFEFAVRFALPIRPVVDPGAALPAADRATVLAGRQVYVGDGTAIGSGDFDGLATESFKRAIAEDLSGRGLGRTAVHYKLRDWLFSRQRFWGEPFPILHEVDSDGRATGLVRPVDEHDLPVDLPLLDDYRPTGGPEPLLEKAPHEWLYPVIGGRRFKRETNTMPQWAGSCWYYLRFLDPKNSAALVDPAVERAWMPVDLYVGGAEHAVLHLLYARFWHKVLYDRGMVSTPEPFQKLVNQGMILGEDGGKMSKSRGNVVNPDRVVAEYGADALRLYEMFMGPLEATKPWSMDGVSGVRGFLGRVWRLVVDEEADELSLHPALQDVPPTEEQNRLLHRTIRQVTHDLGRMQFNTAIARLMEFTNFFTRESCRPRSAMERFVLLLAPFAPHIAEELWQALGHERSLAYEAWPEWDEAAVRESRVDVVVQINGKVRGKVNVAADATEDEIQAAARADERISRLLAGHEVIKVIVAAGKLVSFVVRP